MILKTYLEIVCETILENALIVDAFGVSKTFFIINFQDCLDIKLNTSFQDVLKVNAFDALNIFFGNGLENMSWETEAWSWRRLKNDFDGLGDMLETSPETP